MAGRRKRPHPDQPTCGVAVQSSAAAQRSFAIDFHTGATGFSASAFNLGDMNIPEVEAMLELFPVTQIFNNPVYPTVLHNALIDVGIPAFCSEIGPGRVLTA